MTEPIESPQLTEEPKPDVKTAPKDSKPVDIEGLMAELEKAQVKSPEQLKGRLTNAREYDKVQSERDRLAQEMNELRREMAELKIKSTKAPVTDLDDYPSGKPVDLEEVIRNVYRSERSLEQRMVAEQSQRVAEVWARITGDKRYPIIKDKFEAALRDPITAMSIQTGKTDVQQFYLDMVADHYEDLARRSVEAFKSLKEKGVVVAPHVESSARAPVDTRGRAVDEEKQRKLQELRKKSQTSKGLSITESERLLDDTLGDFLKG